MPPLQKPSVQALPLHQPASLQYGRPIEIEELSNRFFFHPLADVLAKIAIALKISANVVSVLGVLLGFSAAWFYYQQATQIYIFYGFLTMLAWHVFDGADGRIARATNTHSPLGRIIDGVCDHLVFSAVYLALLFYGLHTGEKWIWLWAIIAGISHAVQAASYEERRQKYQRRLRGITRIDIAENLQANDGKKIFIASLYDKTQRALAGRSLALDNTLQKLDKNDPQRIVLVKKTIPIVRAFSLLNPNNRTFMIAIMVFLQHPKWYFLYEIIILNPLLLALLIYEHKHETSINHQYNG